MNPPWPWLVRRLRSAVSPTLISPLATELLSLSRPTNLQCAAGEVPRFINRLDALTQSDVTIPSVTG